MEGVVHDSHDELNEGSRHTLPAIRLLIVIVFWWLFGLILHTYHLAGLGDGGVFASWTESFFFLPLSFWSDYTGGYDCLLFCFRLDF